MTLVLCSRNHYWTKRQGIILLVWTVSIYTVYIQYGNTERSCSFMTNVLLSCHTSFVYTNGCSKLWGHLAPTLCTLIIFLIYGIAHTLCQSHSHHASCLQSRALLETGLWATSRHAFTGCLLSPLTCLSPRNKMAGASGRNSAKFPWTCLTRLASKCSQWVPTVTGGLKVCWLGK